MFELFSCDVTLRTDSNWTVVGGRCLPFCFSVSFFFLLKHVRLRYQYSLFLDQFFFTSFSILCQFFVNSLSLPLKIFLNGDRAMSLADRRAKDEQARLEKEAYNAAMKLNRDAALQFLTQKVVEGRMKEKKNNAMMMGGMNKKPVVGGSAVAGSGP